MTSKVALVIVSHSQGLAEGVCEVAGQMADDVPLHAAGGADDGRVGTSFAKVQAALDAVDSDGTDPEAGAVILADLGSAVMTAESVLEFLDEERRTRFRLADAPLVEGAVAAAVAAQGGASLEQVAAAAESALAPAAPARETDGQANSHTADQTDGLTGDLPEDPSVEANGTHGGTWKLINEMGLHARPAAAIAQAMAPLDAEVTINGVDGKSVMLLMTLALKQGQDLTISAVGPEADEAVAIVRSEVLNGFGEL